MYSILIFLLQYFALAENSFMQLLASLTVLCFSAALYGYYIRVIRTVRHENEQLPEFDQLQEDFKPGCLNMLAILFYVFPVALMLILFGSLFILALPVLLVIWGIYTVGLTRYAFNFESKSLFDVSTNFQMAREHVSELGGLLWRMLAILVLSFGTSIVVSDIMSMLFLGDLPAGAMPDLGTWLILAVINIISYTISVVFSLSQYHVIAQFGNLVLDDERKTKVKNDFVTTGGRQY
jgi:hypothetical protein